MDRVSPSAVAGTFVSYGAAKSRLTIVSKDAEKQQGD